MGSLTSIPMIPSFTDMSCLHFSAAFTEASNEDKPSLHKQYMFIKLSNKPDIGKIDRIMLMWQIYEVDQNSNASILIIIIIIIIM